MEKLITKFAAKTAPFRPTERREDEETKIGQKATEITRSITIRSQNTLGSKTATKTQPMRLMNQPKPFLG